MRYIFEIISFLLSTSLLQFFSFTYLSGGSVRMQSIRSTFWRHWARDVQTGNIMKQQCIHYIYVSYCEAGFYHYNHLYLNLTQDKEVFQSFAQAQVSVTNEIFDYLGHPKFLFCPTQYCTTRAVPTVRNSEYLQTLGSKLAPEIQVSCYRPVLYIQNYMRISREYQNRG